MDATRRRDCRFIHCMRRTANRNQNGFVVSMWSFTICRISEFVPTPTSAPWDWPWKHVLRRELILLFWIDPIHLAEKTSKVRWWPETVNPSLANGIFHIFT